MKTLRLLITTAFFFQSALIQAQTESHSLTDLYNQTNKVYNLIQDGKSLAVIALSDSLIQAYHSFHDSEKYFGHLYTYMAEAAKQQGDISLARHAYELASRYFPDGDEMQTFIIPVNLISIDLDAGRFTRCLKLGLLLMETDAIKKDVTKQGVLLNNLSAAAIKSQNYSLADSLFQIIFVIRNKQAIESDFDIALTYRNFGLFKQFNKF